MGKKVLSNDQEKFLALFAKNAILSSHFVLSGGTALAGFYIFHRYSEDLDFFSQNEFEPQQIFPFLKTFLKPLGYKKVEYQQSFNRNLYFLVKERNVLKTEFTYFPFEPIQKPKMKMGILLESLKDIAVNKIFTIYQKPRMRDFIDLYAIIHKERWNIPSLLKLARTKFDIHIDPLQWGSQLLKVATLQDYPRMIAKMNFGDVKNYFIKEAKSTGKNWLK